MLPKGVAMIVKDCKIELNEVIDQKIEKIIGPTYTVKRFYSEAFKRDYEVYLLESDKRSLVLKHTSDFDEIKAYNLLKSINDSNTSEVYFADKVGDLYWLAMANYEPVKRAYNKTDIIELVSRLATIHGTCKSLNMEHINQWKRPERKDLDLLQDDRIKVEDIEVIDQAFGILSKCTKTFNHGDMIPLNMIVTDDKITIIDWEYGHVAPYILDIGRLLGDYNVDRPWVDISWESEILSAYHEVLKQEGIMIAYDQMILDYQCARLKNYYGIVRAHIIRKWDKTPWYDLNLSMMLNTIEIIKPLLESEFGGNHDY